MLDESLRAAILALRKKGLGIRTIARTMQLSRGAVRDVVRAESAAPPRQARAEKAEPYEAEVRDLYVRWQGEGAAALQERLDAIRSVFQRYPMIPALKAAVAHWGRDPAWRRVRPPLVELDDAQERALIADLSQRDFSMPGLGG